MKNKKESIPIALDYMMGTLDQGLLMLYMYRNVIKKLEAEKRFEDYMQTHDIDIDKLCDGSNPLPEEIKRDGGAEETFLTARELFEVMEIMIPAIIRISEKQNPETQERQQKIAELERHIAEIERKSKAEEEACNAYIASIKAFQDATGRTVYSGDDFEQMYAEWQRENLK